MLVPIAILGLITAAGVAQSRRSKTVDPNTMAQRQSVYRTALDTVKDPAKLRKLADGFRAVDMTAEANMLEKRARLQELSPEMKEARREALRKAMASTDSKKVLEMAEMFENQGCTGAAENLRKYANGLTAAEVKSNE